MAKDTFGLGLAFGVCSYKIDMMKKKVAIVLINYQDYAMTYLKDCRDSLRRQSYGQENMGVYIVDNASSKDTLEYLKKEYQEAIILPRSDGNYCAANNLGFQTAIAAGYKYIITLNMDTVLETRCIEELVLSLKSNKELGIAQAKILLADKNENEPQINTIGNILHYLGFGSTLGYKEPDKEIEGYPEIKGYASGCCFISTKDVYKTIGGWSEEYYMYHDDIEYSLKARLADYKIILAPKARVYHKYEFSRSQKMLYYMERNRYLLALSFYPVYLLVLLLPAFLVLNVAMMIFSITKAWFKTWLKVNLYFLNPRTWWQIFKFRARIKELPHRFDKKIAKTMVGKLEFLEIDNFILRYIANPVLNAYWQIIKKII